MRRIENRICAVEGCLGEIKGRGWCGKHYRRWAKNGGPLASRQRVFPTTAEFLAKKIDTSAGPDGCWPYTGKLNRDGYGEFRGGGYFMAHRAAYELAKGKIPDGLVLDHLCRNRACCNPAHVEPVTVRENTRRGVGFMPQNLAKTHCINGHEFTPENTHITPQGHRRCKQCIQVWSRRHSKALRPRSRMTSDDVRAIRGLKNDGARVPDIAQRFDLSISAVYAIVRRETFKHVA